MRKELARRKEAAANAAARAGKEVVTPVPNTANVVNTSASDTNLVDEFVSILSGTKTNNKKQGKK
jgi:hypothetical protein